MGKIHNGIALYTIQDEGNLIGVYANEQPPSAGYPYPEMAKKVPNTSPQQDPLVGRYVTSWFESHTQIDAHIDVQIRSKNVYDVTWTINGESRATYIGVGYVLNKQFVVHYKSV